MGDLRYPKEPNHAACEDILLDDFGLGINKKPRNYAGFQTN